MNNLRNANRRATIAALALCVIIAPSALAASSPAERQQIWQSAPDSPLVQPAIDLYEIILARDFDAYIDFLDNTCHPDLHKTYERELLERYLDHMTKDGTEWEVAEVRTYDAPRAAVIFRNTNTYQWQGLLVSYTSMDDARPKDFDIVRARPPAHIFDEPITEPELLEEVEKLEALLVDQDRFSGVVAIAKDGRVIHSFVAGDASREYAVPNEFDTRFCLGSMTKMFTALAICRLVEQGHLNLDDPIVEFLTEDWIDPVDAQKVTVRHLLTHSGAVGNFFLHPDYLDTPRAHFREVDSYAVFCKPESLDFEPGSKMSYSNSGFVMLGRIIESVSGRDYFQYMQDEIYKPLGLANTGSIDQDEVNLNIAQGYFYSPRTKSWTNNIYTQRARGCPAGSSYSNAPDLLAFCQQLRAGRIVSPEMLEEMTTPATDVGANNYGYGFALRPNLAGASRFGHAGGGPGVAAYCYMYDSGYNVVILCNAGDGADSLDSYIDELMRRLAAGE